MAFYNEMTLSALIEQLQALADQHEGVDPIVRIAHQPNYPFEHALVNVASVNLSEEEQNDFDSNATDEDEAERPEDQIIVYLAASESNEYLPSAARNVWHS